MLCAKCHCDGASDGEADANANARRMRLPKGQKEKPALLDPCVLPLVEDFATNSLCCSEAVTRRRNHNHDDEGMR